MSSLPTRSRLILAAFVVVTGVVVAPVSALAETPAHVDAASCQRWQVETVASGLDEPENLEYDGDDGFYVSGASTIVHVDTDGNVTPVLDNLAAPRGMQLHDDILYFVDGEGLSKLDTLSREVSSVAEMAAHGLLRLPDGDFLTTDIGTDFGAPPRGLTRYEPDTGVVRTNWSPVPRSEGLAISFDRSRVYTDDLFTGQVIEVPLEDPDNWSVVGVVPGLFPGLDDLTISNAGMLYVAAHVEGAVHSVDPESGATCAIATGLSSGWTGPSSVRIGRGPDGWALYVTVFDGTLRRLTPPSDLELAPA